MEENKVKMMPNAGEPVGDKEAKNEKPTYEQLNEAINKAYQENQYLRIELEKAYKYVNQLQIDNGFKRLDCLFKSLEYSHYFDDEYIDNVIKEIKEMIILKDNNEGSDNENKEEEPVNETVNK